MSPPRWITRGGFFQISATASHVRTGQAGLRREARLLLEIKEEAYGKISGIYVEIKGDSSQLKKELQTAKALVTEQAQGMSKAMGGAFSGSQMATSLKKLTSDLATLSNHSKIGAQAFKHMSVDLGALQRVTGMTASEFSKLQARMLETSSSRAQEQALRRIATAAGLSAAEIRELGRQMNVSAASINNVVGASARASSGLSSLGVAGGMILARLAAEAMELPANILRAGIALDSLQRSFTAIAGSEYGAADFIEYLREESDRLGQSFYDLAPAFKNISAAARGTALEGEPVRKVFSAIAEASTALGMSSADTEGALRALGQMISKGNVQAEELRGQLGERLPGAFNLAAQAMGVTTQQLNKMLKDGDVLATDLLPKLADEIHKMYGAAAETAALESGQAAVNRLSGAWTDLKTNLYDSDSAVAGINKVTEALKTLTQWANLRSVSETFAQGAALAQSGKIDWEAFKQASFLDRQAMVDNGGPLYTFRGKVNRGDVRTASAPIAAATMADAPGSDKAAKAAAKAHEKMLEDGRKAAEAIDAWGNAYDERRIKAIADSVASREQALTKDLQLQTEFADKFKAVVLGETEFKLSQIDAQGEAYIKAGSDEVAVAQWVSAEKLKFSRDWQDGATRAMQAYSDSATDYARNVEEVMGMAFQGMEDAVVQFVKTGKFEFADLVTSINAEIARLAFRDMAAQMYEFMGAIMKSASSATSGSSGGTDWLGAALSLGVSAISGFFGGGSSAAGSAGGGFNYAGEMSSFFSTHHAGGIAGLEPTSMRVVNPAIFAGAGRFHSGGIAGDEVPAILKRGEGVFTEGQMKALGGSNSETTALLRELVAVGRAQKAQKNVFAFDKRTVANELSGPEGERVTLTHVRRNAGSIRRMLGL